MIFYLNLLESSDTFKVRIQRIASVQKINTCQLKDKFVTLLQNASQGNGAA